MGFLVVKVGASWCGKCRQVNWEPQWDLDKLSEDEKSILDQCLVQELPVFIMLDSDDNINFKVVKYIGGLDTKKAVEEWIVKARMEYLAEKYNYNKSEHFDKIVNARIRLGLKWDQCPCGGKGRGCISEICRKEIEEQGHCHCNCYLKK